MKKQDVPCLLFERRLREFVPPGSFDAHAHLFDPQLVGGAGATMLPEGVAVCDRAAYDKMVGEWMGDRLPAGGLFFPWPGVTRSRKTDS
jgi:hypothetical protein